MSFLRIRLSFAPVALATLLVVLLTIETPLLVSAAEVVIPGRITAVTVYRDQARVVREVEIPAADGLQQIRVTQLPTQLIDQSTFTESGAGTNVRSLQVVATEVKAQAAKDEGDVTIEKLQTAQKAAAHELTVIEQDLMTLEKLVTFSTDKVQQNLDRATLDVESVTQLADFTMQRRRKLAEELYAKQNEIKKFSQEISTLQQKRSPAEPSLQQYEALLTVQSAGGGTVRLSYDVAGVSWSPRYKINSTDAQQPDFSVQMEAMIVQDSGESWQDVELTLATSTPQTQAAGPLLAPLRVQTQPASKENQSSDIFGQFGSPEQSEWLDDSLVARNIALNTQASQRQLDELTSSAEVQRKVASDAASSESDVSYVFDGQVSLATHAQPQTVAILKATMKGELYRVATPLLSSFAFREASLTNETGQSLIAGAADVYLASKFVGRIQLPPAAAGQKITIGLGADRQVRTRRELLSREEVIKGGNRHSELKYRLVVSNYHDAPVAIRLLDRIPIAAQDDSINLTLSEAETKRLSEDALYQRMQRPTGILRWDVQIAAKRFGSDAYDHEYAYAIEYDRQQTLTSKDLVQRTEEDLRFKKTNMGGGMGGGGAF
ncbi:MAG: DUF4139 domain-containing protein [Pirellulaceae bacterium]